jgi:formate hydrogenlyase subunit 3/multisubunit Na+/H+ antiporter MnhD subunit
MTDAHPARSESSLRSALHVVSRRNILRRTIPIAFVVGTLLSLVNQAHVVVQGDADVATWLRVAANYAIPFVVSSLGVIAATRAESR